MRFLMLLFLASHNFAISDRDDNEDGDSRPPRGDRPPRERNGDGEGADGEPESKYLIKR